MNDLQNVTLSSKEHTAYLHEAESEIKARLGDAPTLATLNAPNSRTASVLDAINNAGRIITLLVAEFVQSVAVLVIAVVFGVLEYQRVYHGAMALGQNENGSQWIAIAVVAANFIMPIYMLRLYRSQSVRTVTKTTLKSMLLGVWHWITGDAKEVEVSWSHNGTLKFAKTVITYTTIALAVYDLIAPLLTSILDNTASKPMLILIIELIMGLGLSVAGVLFLQSASHEIGVRILTDKPQSPHEVLALAHANYERQAELIRADIRAKYENAKIDAINIKRATATATQSTPDTVAPVPTSPAESENHFLAVNGNGHYHNGNGKS